MAKGVESLLQEFTDLKISCPTVDQLKHTSFDKNLDKNRYKGWFSDYVKIDELACSSFYNSSKICCCILIDNLYLFLDIICVDDTRLVLTWPPGMHDYIHANWVTGILPDLPKQIICTQAPLPNTIIDFWRMVWQEKAQVIVMLCCVIENGKKKCEQYWPEKPGEKLEIAGLTITNDRVDKYNPDLQYTKIIINGPGSDGSKRRHVLNHVLWK